MVLEEWEDCANEPSKLTQCRNNQLLTAADLAGVQTAVAGAEEKDCLLYTSPSPRD